MGLSNMARGPPQLTRSGGLGRDGRTSGPARHALFRPSAVGWDMQGGTCRPVPHDGYIDRKTDRESRSPLRMYWKPRRDLFGDHYTGVRLAIVLLSFSPSLGQLCDVSALWGRC